MHCPACQSTITRENSLLGQLGRLLWYRCRYCGMEFSRVIRKRRTVKQ